MTTETQTVDILWIDDQPDDLKALIFLLEAEEYKVKVLSSSTHAAEQIGDKSLTKWPYFLTIFDINMRPDPGNIAAEHTAEVAGIILLHHLRERFPSAQILVISGVLDLLDERVREDLRGIMTFDKLEITGKQLIQYVNSIRRQRLGS